jgi:hypothetical protein
MVHDRDDNQPSSGATPARVARGRPLCRFSTRTQFSSTPMSGQDVHVVEEILARLVARAYAADHPEVFVRRVETEADRKKGAGFPLTL